MHLLKKHADLILKIIVEKLFLLEKYSLSFALFVITKFLSFAFYNEFDMGNATEKFVWLR